VETNEIFDLLDKFDKSTLSELIVSKGDVRVTLRKATAVSETQQYHHYIASPQVQHVQAPIEHQPATGHSDGGEVITSPIVGTFYRSPSPDSPSFVEPGQKVEKGDTLCVLEAMKVMNELQAEFDCEIVEALVENGVMVEFGTPLFKVKR
jgi:acetyl-CoA carboxylase biotin carboxyl carrier protein